MLKKVYDVKKSLCWVISFVVVLSSVLQMTWSSAASVNPNPVTVKMTSLGSAVKSMTITVNGSYLIRENAQSLPNNSVYSIAVSGSGLTISSGSTLIYTFDSGFYLTKQDISTAGIVLYNPLYGRNLTYLGNLQFRNVNGNIVLYNSVDLETYLYGVVSQEMSDSFGAEALKAQAISARTYVYNKCFFVTDDTTTQAYVGYMASSVNTINAVNATKGMVVSYQGDIIQAFYSARNGGVTETLSRLAPEAMAEPIAVPSSTRPIRVRSRFWISQS